MKILQLYNEQRSRFGGELAVVDVTMRVLAQNGNDLRLVMKSSRTLENSLRKRFNAFWGGIYNIRAFSEMRCLLETDRPDLVHVHSVYPMFSPSILVACKQARVPVVMTLHSHILTCPNWHHLYKGRICEECMGGHEIRCLTKNCRNSILESAAYALRSAFSRRFRLFQDNADVLIVHSPFARKRLLEAGFADDQVQIVPNPSSLKDLREDLPCGEFVGFAGRVAPEKGLHVLLASASQLPKIPFKVAGDGPALSELRAIAPQNVEFLGQLDSQSLVSFYRKSLALVVPSLCLEAFSMVAVDAMAVGLPVIASRIGGLPYVVDDGITGYLFEPGNALELAEKIRWLWEDRDLAKRMGIAGRQKVRHQYTLDTYYQNLMAVYERAIQRSQFFNMFNVAQPYTRSSA